MRKLDPGVSCKVRSAKNITELMVYVQELRTTTKGKNSKKTWLFFNYGYYCTHVLGRVGRHPELRWFEFFFSWIWMVGSGGSSRMDFMAEAARVRRVRSSAPAALVAV
jgi:hypothetical protein